MQSYSAIIQKKNYTRTVLEFTEEAVRTQAQGGTRLQEMTQLFDVSFPELYRMVKRLTGTRLIRAGDNYWLEVQEGASIEVVARKKALSPTAVANAIKKAGYDLDEVAMDGDWGYDIVLSRRAVDAWKCLGDRAMTYFRQKLEDTVKRVNAGKPIERMRLADEPHGRLRLPLTPADFEAVDHLVRASEQDPDRPPSQKGRAKVIRRLIEEMILTMPELALFRPPADLGVSPAYNKIGAGWLVTFIAPVYIWYRMEDMKGKRGGNSPNLSSFMRSAIDNALANPDQFRAWPDPVSYRQPPRFDELFGKPGEKWQFNLPVCTLTLLDEQRDAVGEFLGARSRGDQGRFMCKVFSMASGLDQEKLPGWQEYLNFIQPWTAGDRDEVREHLLSLERNRFVANIFED